MRPTLPLLLAATVLLPGPALGDAATAPVVPRSPLAREWMEHESLPPRPLPAMAPRVVMPSGAPPAGMVLGWLPYWQVPTAVLRLDRLTVLAYFASGLAAGGALGDARDWGTPAFRGVVDAAHAAGVRVVLTVACFDDAVIHDVLAGPGRWKAIEAIVARVRQGDGDGVSVDFEGLRAADRDAFTAFVRDLKDALDQDLGDSHVSVATPAVDWSAAFDHAGLAASADALVIMGYDYHWKGGEPGPVSPLVPSDRWGERALSASVDDHAAALGGRLDRVVLGLPLYGYDWPVVTPGIPAQSAGTASSVLYADCRVRGAAAGWQWDADAHVPWYAYDADGPRQAWCEDGRSIAAKVGLARDRGLAGVAFWAVGYEQGDPEVWDAVAAAFPRDPVPDATVPDVPDEPPADDPGPPADDADLPPTDEGPIAPDPGPAAPEAAPDAPTSGEPTGASPGGCTPGVPSTGASALAALAMALLGACGRRARSPEVQ